MDNKKIKYIIIGILLVIIAIAIIICSTIINKDETEEEIENISISVNYNSEDENTNWQEDNYEDIELSESIEITKSGTYHLTGNIEDGNITVDVGDNDLVKLVLDNVNITCSNSSCINVVNAYKVIIILEEGTTNTLTDGSSYSTTEDEPDGAIFSKDDLVINGSGTLNVNANYLDGIVSKDGLKIIGATINITANDDGIRGKDYVGIKNANISIVANGDGIKSTNDTDAEKGYILIEDSNITIEAEQDGIQAETNLNITGGTFNIKTGGGSSNASTSENWGNWNMMGGKMNNMYNTSTQEDDEVSAKGLKGNNGILIENGTFVIDSSDDSIHSNGTIIINGGTFEIESGDDGIHADDSIYINDGDINIKQSYEGIEAALMEINGGNISLVASDDGINVAGGNDSSSINGRPGQNTFSSSSNNILTINGGYILVDATGDGIDVNGSAYINGGSIYVNGPTNSGNGALDYDGAFELNGGELVAVGASGMMQTPSSGSSIYTISYVFGTTQQANTNIVLKDENGDVITSFTASKTYESVIISSEELEKGKTYTLYIDDEEIADITINNTITTAGSSTGGMNSGINSGMGKGMMMQ